ncbi:hypothetical protein [Streptomyces sp. NPDC001568]|uniref:hypothetical protein n=1 Tax=Streptomyces sp. NPDC001568 TaxID=3364588 RepID=UPI0036BFBD69
MDTTVQRQGAPYEIALIPFPETGRVHRPMCWTSCYRAAPQPQEAKAHRPS